ncbi:MAG: AraC family transcriptional regulator [Cyanobacteria bacterium P01_D01_bin.71]
MAKVITAAEVRQIMEARRAEGSLLEYQEGPEKFTQLPTSVGHGHWRSIQLRPGISLSIDDLKKSQTHCCQIEQHPQPMPLTLSYYLSGGCQVDNDGLGAPEEEVAGKSYLYCLPNTAEIESYPAEQYLCKICIRILPELIPAFSDRLNDLPSDLKTVIEQPEKALLYLSSRITPAQQVLLQQILRSPYQGITRYFYLEAKVLELLALQFDLMAPPLSANEMALKEVDQIYQAQVILNQNISHPPSTAELARQVHLNERKLREGFRQVCNTTVFGYLTQQRMQKACKLLTQQRSIAAVATAVGYDSSTAFSNAFRRQLGISPKGYQLKQRRRL